MHTIRFRDWHQLGLEWDNSPLRNTYSKCKYGGSGTRHTRAIKDHSKRERERL